MTYNLSERLEKRDSGKFTYSDLNNSAKVKVTENASVVVLPPNKWVKLNNQWLLCKEIGSTFDYAFIRLITRPCRRFLDWLLLPIASSRDEGVWVIWGDKIPNTNIFVDVWYVGDGSGGVALAVTEK